MYIPQWLKKRFKFMIHFRARKLNLFSFTRVPKQNALPGFYRELPGRKKLSIPPARHFIERSVFPQTKKRGGELGEVDDYGLKKFQK